MRRLRNVVVALLLVGATGHSARAGTWEDAGWGALSVLSNVGYMPAKLIYATFGALSGGLAYVCTAGDYEIADTIWTMSLGGNYVLTPGMLRGEETVAFAGSPGNPAGDTTTVPTEDARPAGLTEQSLGAS